MADKPNTPKHRVPGDTSRPPPETPSLTCSAGPDPGNPATKNAAVTIYNAGVSVYHLDKKDARPVGIDGALKDMGIISAPDQVGVFSNSRPSGHPWRDPLKLIGQVDQIQAEFSFGKLKGCSIGESIEIPAADLGGRSGRAAQGPKIDAPAIG